MNKLLKKVIAVIILTCIISANLSVIGEYGITYALSETELSNQNSNTQNSNVEFNSYFEGGVHSKTETIGNTTKLFVNIKVKNAGYLENSIISFTDVNFKIDGEINNENVQSVDVEQNKILLNKLTNGADVTIEIPISLLVAEEVALDNFNKETKTDFMAQYIDEDGKTNNVSKQIVNKLSWNVAEETKGVLTTDVTKKIPYHVGEKYGVILQYSIESGIKDSILPIKTIEIDVKVPQLNNIKPTSANVIAVSTEATNGEENGESFTSSNYSYNNITGILTINVANKQDKISWVKNVQDKYLVTFNFDVKEAYNYVTNNTSKIESRIDINSEIEAYNGQQTVIKNTAEKSFSYTIAESGSTVTMPTQGKMLDFEIEATPSISKGQIYANYEAENKRETTYNVNYKATVCSTDLTDKIEFTQSIDQFLTQENVKSPTTVAGNNYAYNKIVKVSEIIFTKILGTEGKIEFLNNEGNVIGKIDKNSQKDENENYVLDISSVNNNKLTVKTSKPISEGIFKIEIEKAIKTNIDYTKNQMKTFKNLETGITAEETTKISLTEPESQVELEINKQELTTVTENDNVEIRVILNTSTLDCALYKNPAFKITLPKYIDDIEIKQYTKVMGDEFTIENVSKQKEDENTTIYVTLKGNQTEYALNAQYKGTIVILTLNMKVNSLTPTNDSKIILEYTNQNEFDTQNNKRVEKAIELVAPTGVVTANKIENYVENGSLQTISFKKIEAELNIYDQSRKVKFSGKIINNYDNKIKDIVVLGRMPAKDTNIIDSTESLNATFDSELAGAIELEGIDATKYTVYYSNNGAATKDLNNSENGWSNELTTETKSYLIITNDYEMQTGELFDFEYSVEIPANLTHNNQASEMYKVYYNNVSNTGTLPESKEAPIIEMTTGEGIVLKTKLEPTVDVIREGQIVKMKATITNIGSITATNIKLNILAPKYATFVDCLERDGYTDNIDKAKIIDIETLKTGESEVVYYDIKIDEYIVESYPIDIDKLREEYEEYLEEVTAIIRDGVIMEELTEEERNLLNKSDYYEDEFAKYQKAMSFPKQMENVAYTISNNTEEKMMAEKLELNIYEGQIDIQLLGDINESEVKKQGEELNFRINIKNFSGNTLNNTNMNVILPNGVKYKSAITKNAFGDSDGTENNVTYNENDNIVHINIGELKSSKVIMLKTEVKDYEGEIKIYSTAKADETGENYSNALIYNTEKVKLKISELTTNSKYIKEGENVEYTFEIENQGKSPIYNLKLTDKLPEELEFVNIKYMIQDSEFSITNLNNGVAEASMNNLFAGEKKQIKITATAKLLKDTNDKEIKNCITITANGMNETKTNIVINVIEYNKKLRDQINGNNDQNKKPQDENSQTTEYYKITGTAWIDGNKDGIRDAQEELLSNVKAILVNKATNIIVKDTNTKQDKSTTTNSEGYYEFNNIQEGQYFVIFVYDSAKYNITEYQKTGIDTSVNSDAIDIEIILSGEKMIAGITDTITVLNSNIRDIDIGLYNQEKFDLRLDKYISKITRTTPTSGTETFEYSNEKLTKIEVLKKNLGKSSIVIEYKIVIKNEGAVAGYAKKVADYLPKGVVFNTELNKDWYLSDNGNVYNTSLENTLINPGEEKELKLVLVKQITEDSIGILNNTAEIYESYNEHGLKDIDSTSANKIEAEDDMSKADIVLGIVTGTKIAIYIILPLAAVSILVLGVIEIKKRVLKRV